MLYKIHLTVCTFVKFYTVSELKGEWMSLELHFLSLIVSFMLCTSLWHVVSYLCEK